MDNKEDTSNIANKLTIKEGHIYIFLLVVIVFFAAYLFKLTGVKSLVVFILVFSLPVYLIISKLNLDMTEKAIFSLFLGIGLFPLAVFYVNRILPSFRIATIVVFIVAILVGIIIIFLKKRVNQN